MGSTGHVCCAFMHSPRMLWWSVSCAHQWARGVHTHLLCHVWPSWSSSSITNLSCHLSTLWQSIQFWNLDVSTKLVKAQFIHLWSMCRVIVHPPHLICLCLYNDWWWYGCSISADGNNYSSVLFSSVLLLIMHLLPFPPNSLLLHRSYLGLKATFIYAPHTFLCNWRAIITCAQDFTQQFEPCSIGMWIDCSCPFALQWVCVECTQAVRVLLNKAVSPLLSNPILQKIITKSCPTNVVNTLLQEPMGQWETTGSNFDALFDDLLSFCRFEPTFCSIKITHWCTSIS